MAKKVRYAGVSVMYDNPSPGVHTPHFHATRLDNRIAVWMHVPGKAVYTYIELPHDMTKDEAIEYLLTQKEFQIPFVRDYLIRQGAMRDPERRKKLLQEEKMLGIEKLKRVRKPRKTKSKISPIHMIEATFGDDEFDEDDIPDITIENIKKED